MKTKQFLEEIADLFLRSDEGTKDWVTVPVLRRSWHLFCGLSLTLTIVQMLHLPLAPILHSSAPATLTFRVVNLVLTILLEGTLSFLAASYYKYVLSKKASIRLDNIVSFYALSTVLFAFVYSFLYSIDPNCFVYEDPAVVIGRTFSERADYWGQMRMKADFFLFSAFQSVNGTFYKIQARGIVVSIFTYFQGLYTLALVGLFIASYVNQKTK